MSRTRLRDFTYARSQQQNNLVACAVTTQRVRTSDAQVQQFLYGSETPEVIEAAAVASIVDSVSHVEGSNASSYTITLPDATSQLCENNILVGVTKTFVCTVAPGLGQSVTILPTTPGAAAQFVITDVGQGVTYVWTSPASGWCQIASGSGGAAAGGSLADALHATATVALGQEPTTSVAFPEPTAFEGLAATLNLDAATAGPTVRPSVAGQRGVVGLCGVTGQGGTAGRPIAVHGGGSQDGNSGALSLRSGEATGTGASGAAFLATGNSFANSSGSLSVLTGTGTGGNSGSITVASGSSLGVNTTTGSVNISSGAKAVQSGDTGSISVTTGSIAGGLLGASGAITMSTGSCDNATGSVLATTGQSANADSGAFSITTGAANGAASGNSGDVFISSGDRSGNLAATGTSGSIVLKSGQVSAGAVGSQTGDVELASGDKITNTGASGHAYVYSGESSGGGNSGDVRCVSGDATGGGFAAFTGSATFGTGSTFSSSTGAVSLTSGAAGLASGDISIQTGQSTSSVSGNITISSGLTAANSQDSGSLTLGTGQPAGLLTRGGHVVIAPGSSPDYTNQCAEVVIQSPGIGSLSGLHLVVSQNSAPLTTEQATTVIAATSSDVAGRFTVTAASVGNVTFRTPFATPPFVVLTTLITGLVTDQVTLTGVFGNGFNVNNPNAGATATVYYMVVGNTAHA